MNRISLQTQRPGSQMGDYAGFFSRLAAFLVDVFVIGSSTIIATWFISIISDMLQFETIFSRIPILKSAYTWVLESPVDQLVIFVYVVGYFVFFWAIVGQTPGKALLGIRIIPISGKKLGFGRALLRYIGYWVSTAGLLMGFIWILIDDRRQGWHDKLCGTYVVYTWHARPDEKFLADEIDQYGR